MEALVCDSERRLRSPGEVEVVGFEAVAEGDASRLLQRKSAFKALRLQEPAASDQDYCASERGGADQ